MADSVQAHTASPGSPFHSPGRWSPGAGSGVRIRTTRVAATGIVTVSGEMDLAGSPGLRRTLGGVCADSGVELLICDFSEVSFLSCSGLSVLVEIGGLLRERGARLCVVARHPAVLRVFVLTELQETLGLCTDLAGALTRTADALPPPGATIRPPERSSAPGRYPACT